MKHSERQDENKAPWRRESQQIRQRYARRKSDLYHPLRPEIVYQQNELRVALAETLRTARDPVERLNVLEVGCGTGANLLTLLQLGVQPERLTGLDLLGERIEAARHVLPDTVTLRCADAFDVAFPDGRFDVILQATVFSSILDSNVRKQLAARLWQWVSPGGMLISYDFVFNNPRNPDVRKFTARELQRMLPAGKIRCRRVTLAPPIARRVATRSQTLYHLLRLLPFLRTHQFCVVRKPAD